MTDSPQSRFRLQHSPWLLLGTVATVGLSIWLWNHREQQVPQKNEREGQAEPADVGLADADPTGSSTDFDLIEIVLVDLMGFNEFRPATADLAGKQSKVVLDEKACGLSGDISDGILNYESNPEVVPHEIAADPRRRNPKERILFSGFKPKNPNILVGDLSGINWYLSFDFEKKFPDAKGYVSAWLPGYSKDGNTAVVKVVFGPTAHGATATYLLINQDGRWKVKWRTTAYFI